MRWGLADAWLRFVSGSTRDDRRLIAALAFSAAIAGAWVVGRVM